MKKLILALLCLVIFGVGCNKEENSLNSVPTKKTRTSESDVYKTENGFLKFKNRDIFDSLLIVLNDMTDEQLYSWEQSLSYTSLYTLMQNGSAPESNLNKKCPDDLL